MNLSDGSAARTPKVLGISVSFGGLSWLLLLMFSPSLARVEEAAPRAHVLALHRVPAEASWEGSRSERPWWEVWGVNRKDEMRSWESGIQPVAS